MWHPSEGDLALAGSGDLGRWKSVLVRRHLRACQPCRELSEEYAALPDSLRELADAAILPPAWLFERIESTAAAAEISAPLAWKIRMKPAAAFAGLLALLVLCHKVL